MKSIFKLRHTILGALLLGSAFALSSVPEAPRIAVHYQDLDLSQSRDAQVLYRRISRAARNVCAEWNGLDLKHQSNFQQCYRAAVNNAVYDVDQKTLTALHQSRVQKVRAS